ncbi:MAG TPA: CotH kinase family protein, partial [Gemmatales bacterium]|nr:CotH kinase family protein [Gemmatales bacterium]
MYRVALLYLILPLTTILAQPPSGGLRFRPPPGMSETRKIRAEFDINQDGWLNNEERQAARAAAKKNTTGMPRFGPPGILRSQSSAPARGMMVQPEDVPHYPQASLYEPTILRTIFIDFDNREDWESELEDFHGTDVDVTATITVDGKKYPNVGIHFRGMSSYMGVSRGYKRSLNLSMDLADKDQRLYGYKTLNLLNAHGDASYLSSVLYSYIASQYIPVPKANLVKVVINGENWGIYVNVQQFNKEFLQEHYSTTKGVRWKVTGSPQARGGLEYLGEDISRYKRIYEIKSKDNDKSWKALIHLCKVLHETPTEQL